MDVIDRSDRLVLGSEADVAVCPTSRPDIRSAQTEMSVPPTCSRRTENDGRAVAHAGGNASNLIACRNINHVMLLRPAGRSGPAVGASGGGGVRRPDDEGVGGSGGGEVRPPDDEEVWVDQVVVVCAGRMMKVWVDQVVLPTGCWRFGGSGGCVHRRHPPVPRTQSTGNQRPLRTFHNSNTGSSRNSQEFRRCWTFV